MRRLRRLHAVALAVALAGCRDGPVSAGVDDSTFVATVAALARVATNPALDSAARESARDSVLQGEGLTAAELEEVARRIAAEDPERAVSLWREIEARARTEQDQGSVIHGTGLIRGRRQLQGDGQR